MSVTNGQSVISISRSKHGLRDRARSYQVMIDGYSVAKIKRGQHVEVPVTSGRHQVKMVINWGSSDIIDLNLEPGQKAELICAIGRSQIGMGYISLSVA